MPAAVERKTEHVKILQDLGYDPWEIENDADMLSVLKAAINDLTRTNIYESLSGTLTEEQQKLLYPHSHVIRKDTHVPWWIKPWANQTPTKSPLRLKRL